MFAKESRANPCQEGLVMNGLLMTPRANASTDKKENEVEGIEPRQFQGRGQVCERWTVFIIKHLQMAHR